MRIPVKRLDPHLPLPKEAHVGDAGVDLIASDDVTLKPSERAAVPTGLSLAIPEGYAGFVHARSGRALNEGLALVNAPGVVDAGYRGEIRVVVVNLDTSAPIYIRRGEKIAQLVVTRVEEVELEAVDELPSSSRGEGGFGSTGR
jgi:dUTP pyrophosphatase